MNRHELIVTLRAEHLETIDKVASSQQKALDILRPTEQIVGITSRMEVYSTILSLSKVDSVERGEAMQVFDDE
ncbi:hypothetical protein [Allorhodopirellula solitaria]|uniref:Uncharacterized protein n=1 Tax=Allorhodopirellula solitaria TaxID=2527987 RepID=A0A5C5WYD6_9BACT|nr:hypothetical protein [Allorhodopirellula solitaria]TWT55696.1 hypothetical protein CA85_47960 [Allorhodopirellula solitaria]